MVEQPGAELDINLVGRLTEYEGSERSEDHFEQRDDRKADHQHIKRRKAAMHQHLIDDDLKEQRRNEPQ